MIKTKDFELKEKPTHYIWRVLPKIMPDCVAPLLYPYWVLIIVLPWFIVSVENVRSFLSLSFGPKPRIPCFWA